MSASNNRLSARVHGDSKRDYVVVYMVEPVRIGQTFQLWPLHMTILPWFSAPNVQAVVETLAPTVAACKPFHFTIDRREFYGTHKVMLVQQNQQLQTLHEQILSAVEKAGWTVNGHYTGSHYTPHVTQKRGRDAKGTYLLDSLYVAETLPQSYRKIISRIELSSK